MSMLPLAVMAVISGVSCALTPVPETDLDRTLNHFRIVYENDAMFDRDENYTNGVRIDYARSRGWQDGIDKGWGVSLTQNMYTPVTHANHAVDGEHPYAGYLGLGGAYFIRSKRGLPWGTLMELQIGVTGEPSLAHAMQHGVHALGRMSQWKGWGDQVPAEPTVEFSQLAAVKWDWVSKSYGYWETEGMFYGRYNVGTVLLSGGVGVGFRVGHNLPDGMGPQGNRPANYGLGLVAKGDGMAAYNPNDVSYYVSTSIFAEYVARDFSVDGGVFRHFNQTCKREPWQTEFQLGVGVIYRGVEYYAGMTAHSRTYHTQRNHGVYGTFGVTWSW